MFYEIQSDSVIKKSRPLCPVCHSKKNVIPIRYGLPVSFEGAGESWIVGGCVIKPKSPKWHCTKDNLSF